MDTEKNELYLTNLIDIETLQMIQDAFSNLTGMAALTTDIHGAAVTRGSKFTDFCMLYTRPNRIGCRKCEVCDMHGAERALERGCSYTYYCHAGLVDFAAPIMAKGEMVGCFIGGQVLTEPPNLNRFRKLAEDMNIDPDEYVEAVKKIPIVDKETIDKAANFLYAIAIVLSNFAYRAHELSESQKKLEKASNMKSDFLANMSHEIRTPMNAVIGLADLALREEMSTSAREYIHQVKASGQNLLVIINDILDFSKIESGKMDIVEVEYESLSLVNDLTGIVCSRIGSKPIEFTMDIDPKIPKMLYGDNVRIHQIILNLLTNAVKFTRQGEVHLKIEYVPKDEETAILKAQIRDTGIGIKEADMKKLFNSFQQVDSKRNRNIEGTGLGLAISQQLLKLMHGKISVDSVYEKGTTFTFELPQKIIDGTPAVPDLEEHIKAALIIGNIYIKRQLMKDLEKLGAEYVDLTDEGSLDDAQADCIIVDKDLFEDYARGYLSEHEDVKCLVLSPYDNMESIDMPNVKVISKPLYSLGLYNGLGTNNVTLGYENDSELDTFSFIAPDATILVVDDNTVNLTVAKGLLEPLKMKIDVAASAAEAIDKIHYVKYDLIFMDHMMPEVDGIEATHIIRRLVPSYNDVPIIALTANAIGGAKEMFIEEGMNDFVAKPIEIKDIVGKLRKWLPKEKIVPIDGDARELFAQENANSDSGGNSILDIKELNTEAAVKLLGTEALFRTVLKEYFCAIDNKYKVISEHKAAERWRDYTVEVHSLKSTSRQIGADPLADMAMELEKAGNDGNIDLIMEKTDTMLEEYLKLKDILAPYFPECAAAETDKIPNMEDILSLLEQMQVALDNFDTLQIDEAIENMSAYKFSGMNSNYFEELKQAAQDSDIEKCSSIIAEWGKDLISSGGDFSDPAVTAELLEKMRSALDAFDTLEIDDVISEMAKQSYSGEQGELFEALKSAAVNTDIDSGNEIVEKWTELLSAAK